jgi:hypothetical protein
MQLFYCVFKCIVVDLQEENNDLMLLQINLNLTCSSQVFKNIILHNL